MKMHDSPTSKQMKRPLLACKLVCLAATIITQAAHGQTPSTTPLETNPTQGSSVSVAAAPSLPPLQAQPSTSDLSSLQDQLKWTEQRASMAEEQARSAQRNIPLLVLLVFFVLPVAFAGGVFFARYRNYQQLNETLRSLMEKGVAIPPELLTPKTRMAPGISDFRKGLLLVWSGIGAMFLLGIILNGSRAWSLGLIPIFTGLAYLVMWKLERRKETA